MTVTVIIFSGVFYLFPHPNEYADHFWQYCNRSFPVLRWSYDRPLFKKKHIAPRHRIGNGIFYSPFNLDIYLGRTQTLDLTQKNCIDFCGKSLGTIVGVE